ncbi:putative acetyltransferase [compost metagenome]
MITAADYELYMTQKGKGWVYETEEGILGFSIVDLEDKSVWALFVKPGHEGKSIGKTLHKVMLAWYFDQTKDTIWLSTAPKSRAEQFYRMQGWKEVGVERNGDLKFELSEEDRKK